MSGSVLFVFLLVDGSTIEGRIKNDALSFETKYGRLAVPAVDVYSIDFGIHFAPGVRSKIHSHIKDLGSPDYKVREEASAALKGLGQWAKHELEGYKDGWSNLEAKTRAEKILAFLADEPQRRESDRLLTNTTDVHGRILAEKFAVRSEALGDVEIGVHQIVAMRAADGLNKKFVVKANGKWQQVAHLFPGDKVRISAAGIVDLWPADRGKYTCGPEGYTSDGQGWNHKGGRLVARIEGEIYSVGSGAGHVLHARTHCVLEFFIVPSPWAPGDITGHYDVQIRRSR